MSSTSKPDGYYKCSCRITSKAIDNLEEPTSNKATKYLFKLTHRVVFGGLGAHKKKKHRR